MAMIQVDDVDRLIDTMVVSWGKMPDYIAQRVDGWQRAGHSLNQLQNAFDYVERKRLETRVADPVALMHVRLQGSSSTTKTVQESVDTDWLYERYHRGKGRCSCCPGRRDDG